MKDPLVTIVTPSFNQGRFIRATIESVLSQNYPRLEYIIMDGGSTDETAQVVSEFAGRLTWISEKDRGQSHAINKGFRMAKGEIVAWLNSDDTFLPGAVTAAVRAFEQHPQTGAVYGEGNQIDIDGNVKSRFPFTLPFDLWRLVYLNDYILQQTVFFRRAALESVGYIDENLNWGMDWDILIRLGKRFGLVYIPEMMGCLREYDAAKTFSGGRRRFRELVSILRRHGKRRYPPGYWYYGLDTYEKIWCQWIERRTPRLLEPVSARLRRALSVACRHKIDTTYRDAQGIHTDGWATPVAHYMLPPGCGVVLIQGVLPDLPPLRGQTLTVIADGVAAKPATLVPGAFEIAIPLPGYRSGEPATLELRASRHFVPARLGQGPDHRRLAYLLKCVRWA